MSPFRIGLILTAAAPMLGGCVVAQVTGAAINTTGAVVSTTARTTGKVVRAVTPDGDNGRGRDRADDSGRRGGSSSGNPASGNPGGGYTRADAEAAARN